MKKIISLALVGALSLALVNPAFAGGRHGGWHGGWWLPAALVGGLAVGSVVAATVPRAYYAPYPAPVYVAPAPVVYAQTQVYTAPVQRDICYPPSGCYRLYGNGVTVAYQWVWMPNPAVPGPPPPPPPGPPLG